MNQSLKTLADFSESIPDALLRASRRALLLKIGLPVAVFSFALPGLPLVFHYSELAVKTDAITPIAAAAFMATCFLTLGSGLVLAGAALHWRALRNSSPTVQLFGDRLVVTFGDQRLESKLCDCNAYEGPAWKMRLMLQSVTENYSGKRRGLMLYCSDRVLLIDIPPFRKTWLSGVTKPLNTAAVGFTEKTKSEWIQRIQEAAGETHDAGESPN